MSCRTQPPAAAFSDGDKRTASLHRSVRFSSESRSSPRSPHDAEKRENSGAMSLSSLVSPGASGAMSQSAPAHSCFDAFDIDDAPPPPASCRFPKLEECAHFHYERVSLGGISIELQPSDQSPDADEGWVILKVRSHVVTPPEAAPPPAPGVVGVAAVGGDRGAGDGGELEWTLSRNAENFRRLDDMLHRCIYDRKISGLPNLGASLTPALVAARRQYCALLADYVHHLSMVFDDGVNCGPVLNWLQMDNKGHKLLVSREDSSSINTPAVAAAYSVRKYTSRARDEISFDVGDMISVIDMPGPSESVWWRGKRGFRVGFFPHACVAVIGDKAPRHCTPPPVTHTVALQPMKPVLRKHGKLISLFRSFILSRPSRGVLKQQGILKERVFGCDLGEHLLNCGRDVPVVLSECARAIERRGAVDGIYRLSGGAGLTQRLRAAFDAGETPELSPALLARDPHAVASLLKMYFRELPNPLCTYQLYERFVAAAQARDDAKLPAFRAAVAKLPPPHYRTLAYLMRHLSVVSRLASATGMTARNMAIVWAPNLLRAPHPQHALQGVAVQAVITEFLICYAEEIFAEEQAPDGAETSPQDTPEQVELRNGSDAASKRPKSLPVHQPPKLLSLEEAQRHMSGASPQPLCALRPTSNHTPNYIEVGSGPHNLPQYHTVLELPLPGGKRGVKRSPSSWRSIFSRSKPRPRTLSTMVASKEETGGVRAARSCESIASLTPRQPAPPPPPPRPSTVHARSSSCDSYFEGWQQELLEMRLRLAPQEQRTDMFAEIIDDSSESTPLESQSCSVEPSPRKQSDQAPQLNDRISLEQRLAGISYIDDSSRASAEKRCGETSQHCDTKRVCKDRDSPPPAPPEPLSAVRLRDRSSPRKTRARSNAANQPVSMTAATVNNDSRQSVASRLSWHGKEGHTTLIKIDWPLETSSVSNLTTSTLNSTPATPVTPVYDLLESDSEVSEQRAIKDKDCRNCDEEKCLQCELKAADGDTLKVEDYTEQNIHDSCEPSPEHEISYQNLNRLSAVSTSSNSEPNSDRKKDYCYENCDAMKLMTSSHESSSSYSNASFTKQPDDLEGFKRPNYINLQSSSTSKSSPGSPLKSPLKSTISITFRSPTKSKSEFAENIDTPTNDGDSIYEDIDLEKNLSIVEDASVPGSDASLPTQQACQPEDFVQDLIILETPTDNNADIYSQVKFFRKSIQEVNEMILASPEKEEQPASDRSTDRNTYENVNFAGQNCENVDDVGHRDPRVNVSSPVDNICEAINNKVIGNASDQLTNQQIEKENGNVIKHKGMPTNLNVRELAHRFESPTEQKPPFNFDKSKNETKTNHEQKENDKRSTQTRNKNENAKPSSPKTYKLDKRSSNTRSLDENAFIKEFGSSDTGRRKSFEVKDVKRRSKFLPDLNLNMEETEAKIESITPTTENKISLIQRFGDSIKAEAKTINIDTDTEKKLSRERIEKYKEERRNFLREKYSSQSFRSNPEQLTRIKLKKDSSEAIDVDVKDELPAFERRNTVDSGQRLRFSLARSANNLDSIQSPLSPKQEFSLNLDSAGVKKDLERKDKISTFNIRDMAAMFEGKSLNSP